jgi:hypothetical protein
MPGVITSETVRQVRAPAGGREPPLGESLQRGDAVRRARGAGHSVTGGGKRPVSTGTLFAF